MIILEGTKDIYMPVRKLSNGGESSIYICENREGKQFAGKLYRGNTGLGRLVRRFLIEQKESCFIRLVDYGIADLEEGERAFEIYEYFENGSLADAAPIDAEKLTSFLIPQLNEALHRLHRIGFLHRDVKPDNLYVKQVYPGKKEAEGSPYKASPTKGNESAGSFAGMQLQDSAGSFAGTQLQDSVGSFARTQHQDSADSFAGAQPEESAGPCLVLGDFGLCVEADQDGCYCDAGLHYTPGYVPSEVLGSGTFSNASDYYAMGVTLYYLLTGHPVFDGMGPDEIMVKTKKGEIASFDGMDKRMAALLEGLLIQDPRYRWGYAEILEWLSGADVPVFHYAAESQVIAPPYQFSSRFSVRSMSELANVMRLYPEEGKKQLYEGFLAEALGKQYPYLGTVLQEISRQLFPHTPNAGLTACLRELEPDERGIYFDGQQYEGLFSISDRIAGELAEGTLSASMEELLSSGLLSYYYKKLLSGQELQKIKQIEKQAANRPLPAAAEFVMTFAGQPFYQPEPGVRCNSVNDYISYIGKADGNVGSLIYRDFNRNYFERWLGEIGLGDAFSAWKRHFYKGERIPDDEYIVGNACQFLEKVSSEGSEVLRHFVLAEAESSPEYWVATHQELYQTDEMMAQMIRENFEGTVLDASMSVALIMKKRHEMREYMDELRRDFLNNPRLYESNVYDASDYRILSDAPQAYFVRNDNYEMVPAGWLMEFGTIKGRNQAKKQYELFTDQACMYADKLEKRIRGMADELEKTCGELRSKKQVPGLFGAVTALVFSLMFYLVWWMFSNRFLSGAGIIAIGGFALAFVFNTAFFIAALIRLNLFRLWNRLLKGCTKLKEIADSVKQRALFMEEEKGKVHLVEKGLLYREDEDTVISRLVAMKGNPEMEALEEHARLSYLARVKKLKNGMWRYLALFLLAAVLLAGGLYMDGSIEFSGKFWKKEISSILEKADPEGWFSSGNAGEAPEVQTTRVVSVSKARLRSGPGTSFDVLNSYKKGSIVELTGNSQSDGSYIWYEVMAEDGIVGWMRSDTIKKEN